MAKDPRSFWAGFGLIVAAGLILAIAATGAVQSVLRSRSGAASPAIVRAGSSGNASAPGESKDALIAAALPGERDPFREPPPLRSEGAAAARPVQQEVREVPICNGLLYDTISPLVELAASSGSSGWLRKGDQFLGWKIVQINPQTVTIAKGSESVVLHSP